MNSVYRIHSKHAISGTLNRGGTRYPWATYQTTPVVEIGALYHLEHPKGAIGGNNNITIRSKLWKNTLKHYTTPTLTVVSGTGVASMMKAINGYKCIVDYDTCDIMVELWGIWHNARHALACQAYWDLYKATFNREV